MSYFKFLFIFLSGIALIINKNSTISKLASGAGKGILGAMGGKFLGIAGDILAARILGPSVFLGYIQ